MILKHGNEEHNQQLEDPYVRAEQLHGDSVKVELTLTFRVSSLLQHVRQYKEGPFMSANYTKRKNSWRST